MTSKCGDICSVALVSSLFFLYFDGAREKPRNHQHLRDKSNINISKVPAFGVHSLWFLHLVVRRGSAHGLHVDAQQELAYIFRRLCGMIVVLGVHLV